MNNFSNQPLQTFTNTGGFSLPPQKTFNVKYVPVGACRRCGKPVYGPEQYIRLTEYSWENDLSPNAKSTCNCRFSEPNAKTMHTIATTDQGFGVGLFYGLLMAGINLTVWYFLFLGKH